MKYVKFLGSVLLRVGCAYYIYLYGQLDGFMQGINGLQQSGHCR
jgi:hypothetical protein